mmetsp:Transcript_1593/g.3648  ORF Transcript_1593/g.3648 Transcript_1593/m.3648 type:complete len:225 (-) Transcript_1593:384-1058(-)
MEDACCSAASFLVAFSWAAAPAAAAASASPSKNRGWSKSMPPAVLAHSLSNASRSWTSSVTISCSVLDSPLSSFSRSSVGNSLCSRISLSDCSVLETTCALGWGAAGVFQALGFGASGMLVITGFGLGFGFWSGFAQPVLPGGTIGLFVSNVVPTVGKWMGFGSWHFFTGFIVRRPPRPSIKRPELCLLPDLNEPARFIWLYFGLLLLYDMVPEFFGEPGRLHD